MSPDSMPDLVVVHGRPASGKSSLAAQLAMVTDTTLLSRDRIKEVSLGADWPSRRATTAALEKQRLEAGRAAYATFYRSIENLLRRGSRVIAETAFHAGLSEPKITAAMGRHSAVLVHCETPIEVCRARYLKRWEAGGFHPGHLDPTDLQSVRDGTFDWAVYAPLALDIPQISIDCSQQVDITALVHQIRDMPQGEDRNHGTRRP